MLLTFSHFAQFWHLAYFWDEVKVSEGKWGDPQTGEKDKKNEDQSSKLLFISKVKPGVCSLIKLDDIEDVLEEAPEKLADSVILFCQVNFPPVNTFLIAPLPGSWLDADSQAKVFPECEHLQSG